MSTTEEAVEQPTSPLWDCQITSLTADSQPWTVGAKQTLTCQGEGIDPLGASAQFQFKEEKQQYTLHILEVTGSGANRFDAIVTAYKAGQFAPEELIVSDGKSDFRTQGLQWTVQSVIEQQSGQPPQPYPPFGPFPLSLPMWYWGLWVAVLVLVFGVLIRYVRRHLERKRFVERLRNHRTALSPYNQFNKDVRVLSRELTESGKATDHDKFVMELDQSFRLFLARHLVVPASEWSTRNTLREIRKRHRKLYKDLGLEIRSVLVEFDKAKKLKGRISAVDCEQLVDMSRRLADQLQKKHRVAL